MKKEDCVRKNGLFWADVVITVICFAGTVYRLWDICDVLSFGGSGALFLPILFTYFLAMGTALLLLWMSFQTGKRRLAAIAAGVQILAPVPWMLLFLKLQYTFTPFEVMMLLCSGAGVFLLLTLPAVRPTRSGK